MGTLFRFHPDLSILNCCSATKGELGKECVQALFFFEGHVSYIKIL